MSGTTAEARVLFSVPTGAARLSNGDIAIATGSRGGVVLVKPNGALRRFIQFGLDDTTRAIHATSWLQACGVDSLFVLDHLPGLITVLNREGAVVRQFQLPPNWMIPTCSLTGQLAVVGRYADPPPSSESASVIASAPVQVVDRLGKSVQLLPVRLQIPLRYTRQAWWREPLGAAASVAIGREYLAVLHHAKGTVDLYSTDGTHTRRIVITDAPRASVQPKHLQRAIEAQLALEPRNAVRATVRRALSAIMPPAQLPIASAALFSSDGLLWVVLSSPGDAEVRLRAYSADGQRQGDLSIPVDMDVLEIGRDHVLGRSADAFGVVHVLEFALRRR